MDESLEHETDVLIIGAGPTGLMLACELHRHGIDCRLFEREDSSTETTRALAIQPRTLQLFEDMGVLEKVLNDGMRVTGVTGYRHNRQLFHLNAGSIDTPYPFLWCLPQNRTEQFLIERLQHLGSTVEYERELIGFEQANDTVTALIENENETTEEITARWLVGCDGTHSQVRKTLSLDFQGVTQSQEFLVADASIDWNRTESEATVWFHEDGVTLAFPLPGDDRWRLFLEVSSYPESVNLTASPNTFRRLLRERSGDRGLAITDTSWTSEFTVNQRMVPTYRKRRVFVAGDAAHIHSPLGGLGMNTGIQDAYNLAWKLALVLDGMASESLLDTYEEERIPVAEEVLRSTGAPIAFLTSMHPVVRVLREQVMARLLDHTRIQSRVLRTTSQLDVAYRDSSLSEDHVGFPLSELVEFSSMRQVASRIGTTVRAWQAPKAGDRAIDGGCRRYPSGEETTLFREISGTTEFVLLLFADVGYGELIDIATGIAGQANGLVRSYLVLPNDASPPDPGSDFAVLIDTEGELYERYGATESSVVVAYLLRPDGYIGCYSRPARALPIIEYFDELAVFN